MEAWDDSDECIIVSASEPWPSLPACVHARRRLHERDSGSSQHGLAGLCVCMRRACMCVRRRLDAPAFVRAQHRRDECKRCSICGPRRLPVCVCVVVVSVCTRVPLSSPPVCVCMSSSLCVCVLLFSVLVRVRRRVDNDA
jgi:hypothetical protein